MPPPTRRQLAARTASQQAPQVRQAHDPLSPHNDENRPPEHPPGKAKSLTSQLAEKDARIFELEAIVDRFRTENLQLQADLRSLRSRYETLSGRHSTLSLEKNALQCLKRKSDALQSEELGRRQKRIRRLERERNVKEAKKMDSLFDLQTALDDKSADIEQLNRRLSSASTHILSLDASILSLRVKAKERQNTLTSTRQRLHTSQRQNTRLKSTLKNVRHDYVALQTFKTTERGEYKTGVRKVVRDLTFAGCAAGKVEFAIRSCAEAFGIKIRGNCPSRRTVARAIDEGGKYGEVQLAREIMNAPGFIEGSDGTTHRGITVEARNITLLAPSYAPGVDDSDQSTWRHRIRFFEAAPALDHTAQRQFEGTKEAAERIADAYSRSPLAATDMSTMEVDDYYRKKMGEHKDHASDGKAEFKISAAYKKEVIIRDLGREKMDRDDFATSQILLTMLNLTDEELQVAGKLSPAELKALPAERRSALVGKVMETKLGTQEFESMTEDQQNNACTHVFGGCCCHKDLNVVRYGVVAIQKLYASLPDLPPPVLLANKANSAIIELSKDPDSAALQNAVDSSSRGAVKLTSLMGSLFRHKDGERGYQDKYGIFMQQQKLEVFGIVAPGKFPDVSNTRYGCHTYAAAEIICFPGLIQTLITEIMDVLKGLNCTSTVTELVALALYGVSVSWPYMVIVRKPTDRGEPVNLISLTPLHRRLPAFCSHIASNPRILLDPNTPLEQITIDGKPFLDELLIRSIREIAGDLPNLWTVVSAMFSGCATGWIRFTPESHVGGTFDKLTPEQLAILHIPANSDCNEGSLGTFRVHMRYHPNSTALSFSNQTRTERNNTEAFIRKHCGEAMKTYVMREVRKDGKKQLRAKFRKAYAGLQREKAEKALARRAKTASKKLAKATHLAGVVLELDEAKIRGLSSVKLKDQLQIYRDILKDAILLKKLWKDMAKVDIRRTLVLEARARELARRQANPPVTSRNTDLDSDKTSVPETEIVTDEFGFSAHDDEEWEDVEE
ncbi:hypothetical protein C8R46DRAFT_1219483 [Mycena filopes]|nr:hypothetical protein C8R46DRAFT_1219483 [Mycena filopes]